MSFDEIQERIRAESIPIFQRLKFDATNWRDLAPVLLSCAIMESIEAVCILGQAGKKIQAEVILRAALEQYVALHLVCKSPVWIDGMLLREKEDRKKTFKRAKQGNSYFSKFKDFYDIDDLIAQNSREIDKLKASGAQWGSAAERFRAAGQVETYEGLYHMLSDSVHSNLIALQNRYLKIQDDKLVVVMNEAQEPPDLEAIEGSTFELLELLEATISHRFLSGQWRFENEAPD